ncbi:hypothetical protein HZA97_08490 [Candidatus Woesearchaeota archaeon]|nr:hypothetical protein [Candidatus Woesearchaeota archaeon]
MNSKTPSGDLASRFDPSINETPSVQLVSRSWPDQWEFTPKLDPEYNRVRRISSSHVAKTVLGYQFWDKTSFFWGLKLLRDLNKEITKQTVLYNLGIAVPRPKGLFNVTFRESSLEEGIVVPGFVMEYIPGITLSLMQQEDVFPEANKMYEEEIRRAKALGFYPGDEGLHNAIWNSEKRKTYLIDFADWEGC